MKRPSSSSSSSPTFLRAGLALALAACGGQQTVAVAQPQPVARPVAQPQPRPQPEPRPPVAPTPDAPFRAEAPPPNPTAPFTAPRPVEFRLRNGLRVLLVERHDLPIVAVEYVTRRGGDDAPVERAGLASMVGALLETGTRTRDALALSDAFEALGAEHGTWMSWDSGGAQIKVTTPNLAAGVELLADVVQNPAFREEEIERARNRRLAALRQERDVPRTIAGNVAVRTVYGDTHPYGRSALGTEAAIRAITRDDILRFYRAHFGTTEGAIVVAGDVTRAALEPLLARTFGRWNQRLPSPQPVPAPQPAAQGPRVFIVDRPGAPQSHVIVAHAGVPRSSRDHVAIVTMNTILGGMFSSRINLNLREAHEYTYGAGSSFSFRHGPGPFVAGGAIHTTHTGAAIRELLSELARIRSGDVEERELAAAKARIVDSLPARFEGVEQTADAIEDLFVYELPMDEYVTLPARVGAVTAADVRRVAQSALDPDHARIIVVGDRSVIEPQLRELNLGEIEVRDPLGERPSTPGQVVQPPAAVGGQGAPGAPAVPAPNPQAPR